MESAVRSAQPDQQMRAERTNAKGDDEGQENNTAGSTQEKSKKREGRTTKDVQPSANRNTAL